MNKKQLEEDVKLLYDINKIMKYAAISIATIGIIIFTITSLIFVYGGEQSNGFAFAAAFVVVAVHLRAARLVKTKRIALGRLKNHYVERAYKNEK